MIPLQTSARDHCLCLLIVAAVLCGTSTLLSAGTSRSLAFLPPVDLVVDLSGFPGDSSLPGAAYMRSPAPLHPQAPVIGEWNRVVKPDESFTLTGTRFSLREGAALGSDTTVWILAAKEDARPRQIPVWVVEADLITALVPSDLSFGLYWVWVENEVGVSSPVALNRSTPQWIGPLGHTVAPGETKRIFGFSLSRNHGEDISQVYLHAPETGHWLELEVGAVEPYAVEFTVPTTAAAGDYQLFVHNGHGGGAGLGGPVPVTVADPWVRGSAELRVAPTGDDSAAIQAALNELGKLPDGGTLRLEAGDYVLYNGITVPEKVRLLGTGKATTMLDARLQRSHRFVAVFDESVSPARWAAGWTAWVTPSRPLPQPVNVRDGGIRVSYGVRLTRPQSEWWYRPVTQLQTGKEAISVRTNQDGSILVYSGDLNQTPILSGRMAAFPLDRYLEVKILLAGGRLGVWIDGDLVIDGLIPGGGPDRVDGIRLMGLDPGRINQTEPIHYIADFNVEVFNGEDFQTIFRDNFYRDISGAWQGVQDRLTALRPAGNHSTIEGFTLRSNRDHLNLMNVNDLRVADLRLIESSHGFASAPLAIYGERVEVANVEAGTIESINAHPSADYWFHGNTVIGQVGGFSHAGIYANGRRAVMEHNLVKNDWPEGKMRSSDTFQKEFDELPPMPWVSRVVLVGGRAGSPRMYHHYFAHNTARNVAWQGNVAEMILLHSLTARWFGQVVENHGLTAKVDISGTIDGRPRRATARDVPAGRDLRNQNLFKGHHGDHVMIIAGTGIGQMRRLMDFTEDTLTVDQAWRIEPDSTSVLVIAPMNAHNIIYRNDLEAFPEDYQLTQHSASTGVSLYANAFRNFVEANHSKRTHSGRAVSGEALRPSWWNEFRDEIAEDVRGSSGFNVLLRRDAFSPVAMGNTFKHGYAELSGGGAIINQMSWYLAPTDWPEASPIHAYGNIFEHLRGEGASLAIFEGDQGPYGVEGASRVFRNLYRNNILNVSGSTGSPPLQMTERSHPILVGNTIEWEGEDRYQVPADGVLNPQLVPLYRALRMGGEIAEFTVPVVNGGTIPLNWSVKTNDAWIKVKRAENNPLAPGTMTTFQVSADATQLTGNRVEGSITLRTQGQELELGVFMDKP